MATVSLPSLPVSVVDVPEPAAFRAHFIYNFFTRDEVVNDTGNVPEDVIRRAGPAAHADFFESINEKRRIPRSVRFDFVPVTINSTVPVVNMPRLGGFASKTRRPGRKSLPDGLSAEGISITENLGKIVSEETFAGFGFTGVNFQDTEVDGKLYFLASASISSKINFPAPPFSEPDSFAIDPPGLSFLQAAAFLNRNTPDDVDSDIINEVLNQPEAKGARYENDVSELVLNRAWNDIKGLSTQVQVNNRHVHRMLDYLVSETTTIYCDEIRSLLPEARKAQEAARNSIVPDTVSVDQYRTDLPIVDVRPRNEDAPPLLSARVIGYIIDKYEIPTDRRAPLLRRESIVVEAPRATSAIDFKVKYGAVYTYSIRAVAAVDFPAINEDTGQVLTVTSLVSSRATPRQTVDCTEKVPPPSPADFNITWDFGRRAPRLAWGFPVNPQRDIKKFQVFRRRTIREPFQLVREYDFNDAQPRLPDLEEPEARLVTRSPGDPQSVYTDMRFDQDSVWIYAVCAVDAHGLTSPYSAQYRISFNRFQNQIVKELVSRAGAPKAYPNLYLEQDLFLDSIQDSGHTHMKVIFNPEFLNLRDNRGSDLELLSTNETGGKYRLQFINVDFQKQQDLDLFISDRRLPKSRFQRGAKTSRAPRPPRGAPRSAGSIGTGISDSGGSDDT